MQKHSKISKSESVLLTKKFKAPFSMAKNIKIFNIHLYNWLQILISLILIIKNTNFQPHTTLVVFLLHLK